MLTQIVRETSVAVDRIEDQLLALRLSANRADLGAMRRVLVRLQRLLALEPGSLLRLLNRRRNGYRMPTCVSCAKPPRSSPW